jgi:hypothetical protein
MGFRSVVISDIPLGKLPHWFESKWMDRLHLSEWGTISSIFEMKTYTHGGLMDLPEDIQRVIAEKTAAQPGWDPEYPMKRVLVYLHECGGISRCEIDPYSIKWTEPSGWKRVEGVTHDYCYGCSAADRAIQVE